MSEEIKETSNDSQTESQSNADNNDAQASLFDMVADDMEGDESAPAEQEPEKDAKQETDDSSDDDANETDQEDDDTAAKTDDGGDDSVKEPLESKTVNELVELQKASQAQIAELTNSIAQISEQVAPKEQAKAEPYYKGMLTSTPEQIKQQLETDANGNSTGLEIDGVAMKAVAHLIDNALQGLMGDIGEPIEHFKKVRAVGKAEAELVTRSKGEIKKFMPEINKIFKAKYPKGFARDTATYAEVWATYEGLKNQELRQNALRTDKKLKAAGLRNANTKLKSHPSKSNKPPVPTGFDAIIAEM